MHLGEHRGRPNAQQHSEKNSSPFFPLTRIVTNKVMALFVGAYRELSQVFYLSC